VARLADPKARNAPGDGWREIASSSTEVTFAAPLHPDVWWIEAFAQRDGVWRQTDEEIANQRETPAQRGHGLELRWDGEVVMSRGRWTGNLSLVNRRADDWVDDGGVYNADVHVFDPTTGRELAPGEGIYTQPGKTYDVPPGAATSIGIGLGGKIGSLESGMYDLVACVPDLGLASPVGTLRVVGGPSAGEVHVLTYHYTGASMLALAVGKLTVQNGCLAIGNQGVTTYVVWPEGYAFVDRDGREVLIDPVGNEVAALGDELSLGGGFAELRLIEDNVIGGVPESCRTGGEGYFITSGRS
jgi:hypothetical protein